MKVSAMFLFLILILGCKHEAENQIRKIEIAMQMGWEDGRRAISIDNRQYVFFGDGRNEKTYFRKGYFEGRVSERFWDTLNSKFTRKVFDTLQNQGNPKIADVSTAEVIIYWKDNTSKKIKFYGVSYDNPIKADLIWLLESCRKVHLYPTKPYKFETMLQNPLPTIIPRGTIILPPTKKELKEK